MTRSRFSKTAMMVLAIVIGLWLLRQVNVLPSLRNIFAKQLVTIDRTPLLIKEIKSIAQLVTVTSLDEVVVDSIVLTRTAGFANVFNSMSRLPLLPVVEKELVLICKGKVLAGTDLGKLAKNDLIVAGDSITVRLPRSAILDVIINPSDFETFTEKGTWAPEAVTSVKLKAKQKLVERALNKNILQKSAAKASLVFENFFRNAGFKTVIMETTH